MASKWLFLIRHRHEKKARVAQTSETVYTTINSWVVLWPFSQCLSWWWAVLRSAYDITAAVRSGIRTATSAAAHSGMRVHSVYYYYCMYYYTPLLLLVADIMTVSKCILLVLPLLLSMVAVIDFTTTAAAHSGMDYCHCCCPWWQS